MQQFKSFLQIMCCLSDCSSSTHRQSTSGFCLEMISILAVTVGSGELALAV